MEIFISTLVGILCVVVLWTVHRLRVRVLTERARNVFAARLSERERIAREFHDNLLQGMQGLILLFEGMAVQIPPDQPLASKLEAAITRTEQLVSEGRDNLRDLRVLNLDLADTLRSLNGQQRPREAAYSVKVSGRERELQLLVSDEIFTVAREAIMNAFHHASAQNVWVTLAYARAYLELKVVDDGRCTTKGGGENEKSEHLRLVSMKLRANRLEGTLQILNREPTGTEVQLRVPARIAYRAPGFFGADWIDVLGTFFGRRRSGL